MNLLHIYCGDGKGKTTAAIGLTIRALGSGMKALFVQFMKNPTSSELKVLKNLDHLCLIPHDINHGFVWNMDEQERLRTKEEYKKFINALIEKIKVNTYDLVVFDEILSCVEVGFIEEEIILKLNEDKNFEFVLTGRNPSIQLIEKADYVSEVKAIKHPFDQGINSRKGIEF